MTAPYLKIMTPCFGGQVTALYANSLLKLSLAAQKRGLKFGWRLLAGDALITRARAECVALFLEESAATHLLFIDADIGFEPEQAFRLLDYDADVVAAAYPLKGIDWEAVKTAIAAGVRNPEAAAMRYCPNFGDDEEIHAERDFARVSRAGAGFLMIRRAALLRLCAAYPQLRYRRIHALPDPLNDSPHRAALFDPMIDRDSGEYLGDDIAFCRRWTDIGGEIWLDLHSRLTHVGPMAFEGDLFRQLAPQGPTK